MKRKNSGLKIKVSFWGVRGSIATHDLANKRHGGHTACVAIEFGPSLFVCDGGTGIHRLGHQLSRGRLSRSRRPLYLFLSHLHWDHIFGFPFFEPFYQRGRPIFFAGPSFQEESFQKTFQRIMRPPYFPIGPGRWPAQITWKNLGNGALRFGSVKVDVRQVWHQGKAYGFQFHFPDGKRVVYVTDHELRGSERSFGRWIRGADLLIHDTHYDRREYKKHKGWGHSAYEDVLELAIREKVKKLVLFHHNPDASDRLLEKRLKFCRSRVKNQKSPLKCVIAKEGLTLSL